MKTAYQPLVLRIIHGLQGITVILALITALWTYNSYDGRWFKLPLPNYPEIESIHGTFGLAALLLFPLFILYAFNRGEKRLLAPEFLSKLLTVKKPIIWHLWHRFCNTFSLLALSFGVFSGKMMDEKWLPQGELHHTWYYLHLLSWIILVIAVFSHIFMSLKVGGSTLILSMINIKYKSQDSPRLWKNHLQTWWQNLSLAQVKQWWKNANSLKYLQLLLLIIVVLAWVISIIKEST